MTTWHVNSAAAPGGDGSVGSPWNLFSAISWNGSGSGGPIVAGDTVSFSGAFTELLEIATAELTQGTAALPVTLVGNLSGVRTTINATTNAWGMRLVGRDYFEIYGFHVSNADQASLIYGQNFYLLDCEHVTIRDCIANNAYWDNYSMEYSRHCLIYDCISYDSRARGYTISGSGGGPGGSGFFSTDNLIRDCVALNSAFRGYTISGDGNGTSDCLRDVIKDCTSDTAREGTQFEHATNCTLDRVLETQNAINAYQIFNELTDCTMVDCYSQGGSSHMFQSLANLTNFTIDDCLFDGGLADGMLLKGTVAGFTLKNSTIYNIVGAARYAFAVDGTATVSDIQIINNNWQNLTLGISVLTNWGGANAINQNTFGPMGADGDPFRDAIVIRTVQTGAAGATFTINDNIFDATVDKCIEEAGGQSGPHPALTHDRNFYSSQSANLVVYEGLTYNVNNIATFEPTFKINRSEAIGYVPTDDGTGSGKARVWMLPSKTGWG